MNPPALPEQLRVLARVRRMRAILRSDHAALVKATELAELLADVEEKLVAGDDLARVTAPLLYGDGDGWLGMLCWLAGERRGLEQTTSAIDDVRKQLAAAHERARREPEAARSVALATVVDERDEEAA